MFRWAFAALLSAAVLSLAFARADNLDRQVTLEEAIARALNASAAIQSREELIAGAEAGVRQSGVLPNPEIDFELENFAGSGSFKDLDDSELTFGVSQRIERSGKRDSRVAVAQVERDLAAIERDRARLDVVLEARRGFIDVGVATIMLDITKHRLDSAKQIEAMAVRRVRAARDPITVKLRAELQTAEANSAFEQAVRAVQTAKKKLASLWGEPDALFGVDTSTLLSVPGDEVPRLAEDAPDLRASEAAARRAASKVDLENANARSDLSVGLGVRRFENGGDLAGVVSVSVPLAIFDTNQDNIERAAAERRAADFDLINARRELEREALTLQGEIAGARAEAVVIRRELLPRAEEASRAARRGYDAGAFSYFELSETQRTLNELRTREIEALQRLHVALAGLDRLLGRTVAATTEQGKKP